MKTVIVIVLLMLLSSATAYEVIFPAYGGKITIQNAYLPSNIDPVWHVKNEALDLDKLLYDTLCSIDKEGTISLMLLKNASMEGNVWNFELNSNLFFTAHKATLSSYDVKNSIMHLKEESNAYRFLFKDINSVKEINALSFSVELNQPDSLFLNKLCHPSASIIRRWKNINGEEEIMGTGPFRIKENRLPESITLEANEFYFKGRPFIDEITFLSSTKVNPLFYFKSGSIHLLSLYGNRRSNTDDIIASSAIVEAKPPVFLFLLLNPHSYPTSDARFRNWIERIINPAEILQSMFNNRGEVITSLFSGFTKEKKIHADKVAYTGEIEVLALKKDLISSLIAERIQAILISEGFKTKINYQDDRNLITDQQSRKFHILVGTMAPYYKNADLNIMEFCSIYASAIDYSSREVSTITGDNEIKLLNETILIPLISLKREYVANDKIHFYMNSFDSLKDLQNAWLF